jgi:acyl dehydratase
MSQLSNFTIDELTIGQKASFSKHVTEQDVVLFAAVSGDVNPVHLDEAFAKETRFGGRIAHGMLSGAVISAALAMELPGPGVIYLGQTLRFTRPVRIGDQVTANLEVTGIRDDKAIVTLACDVTNQDGKIVVTGEATVLAPSEKIIIERPDLPRFKALE